jgi:hypothetical protein
MSIRVDAFLFGAGKGIKKFCWDHQRIYFRESMGLLSNGLNQKSHWQRVMALRHHLRSGGDYLSFVSKQSEGNWFNLPARANHPAEALRPYRFPHDVVVDPTIDPAKLFALFTPDAGAYDLFRETGNIIIPDFFAYLNTDEMRQHIDQEFRMYRYHFHPSPGLPSMGFLRNCYYSLIQQAIRMDPGYYVINVAARPNHQWRLITYPYVAKATTPGERTFFMHLDINLDEYFSSDQIGHDQLTSSVSLDNEDNMNCTCVVPGFTRHVKKWHQRVKNRLEIETMGGRKTEAAKNYTAEDAALFGSPQPCPCPAFSIRVTYPTILHGSSKAATITRKVVYPWYTAIQSDHETLEIPGQHTWSELAALHRDLEAPVCGVAGERISQARPPYRFPGAVMLASVSPLSDALVGRRRWTDPEVLHERNVLLGSDGVAALKLISEIRSSIYHALIDAYQRLVVMERSAFGPLSYFNHPNQLESPASEQLDPDASEYERMDFDLLGEW